MARRCSSLRLESLDVRDLPSGNQLFAVAEDAGGSHVSVYEATGPQDPRRVQLSAVEGSGRPLATWEPFAGMRGGVHVAVGDVTGDGIEDVIAAPGAGGAHIRVYDGQQLLQGQSVVATEFFAYDPAFSGGAFVAVGQFDPSSPALEIVTGAGSSGGAHVKVFSLTESGQTGFHPHATNQFFAFDGGFRGGVRVAAGDVTGDGQAEVIAAAGPGGGPHVRIFEVTPPSPQRVLTPDHRLRDEFFAYDPGFHGGVCVAAGELDGNNATAEVVTGAGQGGGPHVRVYGRGNNGKLVLDSEFFAAAADDRGGVCVGLGNLQMISDRQSLFVGLGPRQVAPTDQPSADARLRSFVFESTKFAQSQLVLPPQFSSFNATGLMVNL